MKISIKNQFLEAVFKDTGAELISLTSNDREYIWNGNPKFWAKHSPVLFPIVGTLKNDTYYYENKRYELSRHGFARDKKFQIIKQSETEIVFSLKEDQETLQNYPFHFELQIAYELLGNQLKVRYTVLNNSNSNMYFSIGGHPAFALYNSFEDYSLKFETSAKLEFSLLKNDLISSETQKLKTINNELPLNYKLFQEDALVFKNQNINTVTITQNTTDLLRINVKNFPDLGIWTKNNAPFICIEPWFGHADLSQTNQQFVDKEGILFLEKEGVFNTFYSIEILTPNKQ
ncbi:aldose 1-epimerase family protein [Flavobacterium sp.]|uniref:aldose 1-epimerase family protein n=1 Tax=Flavobacterium sp. TaxID=239 RepID=UPI002610E1E5|nr:aldose 1-epimerase family protein [Flavobacterium sp.]MDD3003503.1 aldose 1-epimerase family protein [Flavobacterium sp.]